ncbi:SMP-30/gluconolactonase/LRE family protein [Thalassotalea euphylliae]|uniref:SMP-30/gluconolactonase/LRE family protein n=1 Tax=Thalassotalea euphylliae TaxID=1655234 RepID=A0A3E0U1S6_9GAMM|nr:SMP-30/gluconolactonase/LRE family protein [Thalassotalea euphylliae]REL30660.1 SMP-30/gluconolactonase/LRE family protein [Thalassotalea euphylliae]
MKLIKTLAVGNQLAEGVLWHPEQASLWWTDIKTSKVYEYQLRNDHLKCYSMPERVGCFAFTKQPQQLLVAFASGIALYDLASRTINWLAHLDTANQGHRLNDGRLDRSGRFWVGGMLEKNVEKEHQSAHKSDKNASLFQLEQKSSSFRLSPKKTGIKISNSLCFSPDGKTMYHADSPTGIIYQYQVSADLQLTNEQIFAKTEAGAYPDGACIDKNGNLWSAQWGGSRVVQYSPQGQVVQQLDLPVSQPTCVAIGGPNRNLLAVTSARDELTQQQLASEPEAGNIFIYQLEESIGIDEVYANVDDVTVSVQ